MRGHTRCRPHRDPELGPRGAGAPSGNLNALRTGQHAYPLSPEDLDQLVDTILGAPDQLPGHLDRAIRSIHRRCPDPVKALLALQALLPTLLSRVADGLFTIEFPALINGLPPAWRSQFEFAIWHQALELNPVRKLEFLRRFQRHGTHGSKASPGAPFPGTSPAPSPDAPSAPSPDAPSAPSPDAPSAPPGRHGATAPDDPYPDD
jgi:hypothetical protein